MADNTDTKGEDREKVRGSEEDIVETSTDDEFDDDETGTDDEEDVDED